MMMSIAAAGALIGPPISGAINNSTGGYEAVGYYAGMHLFVPVHLLSLANQPSYTGTTVIVSFVLMLITRHLVLQRLWGKF